MSDYFDPDEFAHDLELTTPDFDVDNRDGTSAPIGGYAVNWRTIDPETAVDEWQRLRDWVEWFTVRYTIASSAIPNCWWRHGGLVEELSALHSAWVASFDPSDAGLGPIGWHERLAVARARWREVYNGGCTTTHRDDLPRTWENVTPEHTWSEWISTDHRPAQVPN
ncbi:hypothetical protein [Microbacterium sp. SLBN-111]|uniref:hypothetical protein n=1 Tax=Microbacterium sp. SLBN-111 TaxID=3377733 RepID=UPI003C75374C